MYRLERIEKKDFPVDYEEHFNRRPKDSIKISEKKFFDILCQWSWDLFDSKQILEEDGSYKRSKIFMIETFYKEVVGIYVAINSKTDERKFYEFGNWNKFQSENMKAFQ